MAHELTAAFDDAIAELRAAGRVQAKVVKGVDIEPMLAETSEPFSRDGWLFELKLDGYRAIAGKDGERVTLHYRRGREQSAAFPEIADALRALPIDACVLDGEICVLDERGRPSFQRLQKRALRMGPRELPAAMKEFPAHLLVFDVLAAHGVDLRPLPLTERKRLLSLLLPRELQGRIRVVDALAHEGESLFEAARNEGLEGVVGKRADSPYRAGRS
ncbi:MAG: DNA ligase, partial [Deltaproteobacteria bacterium]|nr:DNA ligase [Deltaproteobacteria bacterium]